MQYRIGNPGDSAKLAPIVEIGDDRNGTQCAQAGAGIGLTRQRKDLEAPDQPWNRPARHITAADNQYSFHPGIISRPMQFQISTLPGNARFPANEDETVLEAALAAGWLLPYGCRDGACGSCKARIVQGRIEQGQISESALSDEERTVGYALLCRARPRSDLVIEVRNSGRVGDFPVRKLPCRIQELRRAADDVMILTARLPAGEPFRFRAGQYIDILLADGRRRSFSLANPPESTGQIELHIRLVPGGQFTRQVFETLKVRDILRFEGPFGSFSLREDEHRPAILLAGGTGFAPIKSIVEHAIATGAQRKLVLYWGARTLGGLYMDSLAASWEGQLPGFRYVPVLSDPDASGAIRTGLVHKAVMADHPDLSAHEVYACGAPAMIDAARRDLIGHCALPAESFYADVFTFASDSSA